MLQHGSVTGPTAIPESTIKLMLDKKVYCAVQPRTAKRLAIELENAEDAVPSRRAKERLQTWHDNEVRLVKAHVPMLLATDGGMMDPDAVESMKPKMQIDRSTELGEGHFLWFKAMVEKGMTPMEAIVSATRNIAAAYHKLDQLGTVEAGKLADLVVLDADPLQDVEQHPQDLDGDEGRPGRRSRQAAAQEGAHRVAQHTGEAHVDQPGREGGAR